MRTKGHPFRGTTSVRRACCGDALIPMLIGPPTIEARSSGFAVTGSPVPVYSTWLSRSFCADSSGDFNGGSVAGIFSLAATLLRIPSFLSTPRPCTIPDRGLVYVVVPRIIKNTAVIGRSFRLSFLCRDAWLACLCCTVSRICANRPFSFPCSCLLHTMLPNSP